MNDAPISPPRAAALPGTELAPATLNGWFVLHQLFRVDWSLVRSMDPAERRAPLSELLALLDGWSGDSTRGWSAVYRMVGGGVDLMFLHFRPTLDDLTTASHQVALSGLSDVLVPDHEYVSVVELGMYPLTASVADRVPPSDNAAYSAALEEALAGERDKAFVRRRIYPVQPDDMPYVSYYPMDKRRDRGQNWYALPLDTRASLMKAHGTIGRRYAGRITQVISGSVGFADWEWAVTLWAADPLVFKEIVTEMRYDEASAVYGEFGRFFVGRRMTAEDISALWP
ncbi:MAG: hydrogen peroxide-dependent heme synthase [Gemmatimonadota bacterium]